MARAIGTVTAVVTVAGCAAVVIGMAKANADKQHAAQVAARVPAAKVEPSTTIPAQLPQRSTPAAATTSQAPRATSVSASTSSAPKPPSSTTVTRSTSTSATPSRTTSAPTSSHPVPTTSAVATSTSRAPRVTTTSSAPKPSATSTHSSAPKPTHATPKRGVALPLHMSTGTATRVITVKAAHTWSTTASLQAWTKAPGGGWLKYGAAVTAHLGSQGMSSSPSESKSATPIGSFTLTRAFGHYSNPGTKLPYVHTTPADWWISQSGSLYNTLQHCSSHCAFNQGSPNEHLYYETPFYNYAVVIDYNTRNAGKVRQGAGSAFFLHVTDGGPTAGCVSISQTKLISLMRWLTPTAHPRILIGT